MRSLLVLIDGLGDEPIAAFNGKTPFEQATHFQIDKIKEQGTAASVSICEDDIVPESCSCILRLLGTAKRDIPQSRSYLELLAHNRDISEYEMVLRCNLVAVDNEGRLLGFNGYGLSAEAMQQAAQVCDDIFSKIEFIHLSEYRNLLIMDKEQSVLSCIVPPPHENVGENVQELLQELISKSLSLKCFLEEAKKRLQAFAHDGISYQLYPWGSAARHSIPSFEQLHRLKGAAVCKAEIVAGIAKSLGMEVIIPHGATGDVDTDVKSKARATLQALSNNDFVIAHFNGTDEAAHRYNAQEKADFIEKIDSEFLVAVLAEYHEPLRILICGDHVTSSVTGKHGRGKVPVIAGAVNCPYPIKTAIHTYQDILNFLMRKSD